jgi:hypothetical protein
MKFGLRESNPGKSQPDGVPAEDAMLAQKLWIETDEEKFIKVANFSRFG